MLFIPIESDRFTYEHLFDRKKNLAEIQQFTIDKPTGKGLEFYLKNMAEYEERKRSNRTYLVRDKNTDEIAGYFSLRTGLFTLDSGREKESDDDITFYSVPSIELSNFAVNSAYRSQHLEISKIGKDIFANFVLPIAQYTAQLVGVQALHIYALPQDDLIEHYQSFGFHRLNAEMEAFVHKHVKPMYDKRCIFMFLPL
ncbi:MAG: hypothetical protein IJP62_06295 [Treponema sp.]|nr:hypothetical protein [Treponema sp.]